MPLIIYLYSSNYRTKGIYSLLHILSIARARYSPRHCNVPYTVEPLLREHHWDGIFCPLQ